MEEKFAAGYVVNGLCQHCKDTACVKACPAECFYEPINPDPSNNIPDFLASGLPDQLYIHPDECINCNACVAECPWEAITSGRDVPDVFVNFIDLNARSQHERKLFKPAFTYTWYICPKCQTKTNSNTPACQCGVQLSFYYPNNDEVAANKKKWGIIP